MTSLTMVNLSNKTNLAMAQTNIIYILSHLTYIITAIHSDLKDGVVIKPETFKKMQILINYIDAMETADYFVYDSVNKIIGTMFSVATGSSIPSHRANNLPLCTVSITNIYNIFTNYLILTNYPQSVHEDIDIMMSTKINLNNCLEKIIKVRKVARSFGNVRHAKPEV